jgi:hypothetical protein
MRGAKLTPEDFGLKVRNDSEELKITASNKMRNALDHIEQISYWGKVFDTPYLDDDHEKNLRNLELSKQLLNKLISDNYIFKREENAKDMFYRSDIPSDYILSFLKKLSISLHNVHFDTKQIIEFLESCDDQIISKWDVVLIEGERGDELYKIIPGISINPVKRSFDMVNNRINIGGRSARLGSPTDARNGLSKQQIEIAKSKAIDNKVWNGISSTINQEVWFKFVENRNPLLMIYFIKLASEETSDKEQIFIKKLNGSPAMGFSIGFPVSKNSYAAKYHKYKVNIIYSRQEIEEYLAETIEE